ncbi:MAG: hypothetical protein KJ057_03810 [Phycisphaerae bacterium]|nr:MAG: hypothetical protein F9K17_05790 [Phycisphaerae bacterium]MBE7457777.1 hypothetical protein [Planctomycetia bacterium]MCK6463704.1 hypothetical protein [Phycisphaerae bacterium]MCL4717581.1 hypothetical protein [Phycisphaerae bacterium]NUQ08400.1 hypothetical protein [Phycisphaerae bacterium]
MPSQPLMPLEHLDADHVVLSRADVYERFLPHRHEFMLLDGICHVDLPAAIVAGVCRLREDAWWVRGHVPGRPILPGVLMLEMAAQTACVGVHLLDAHAGAPRRAFVAFGGVDECKFRDAVSPPATFLILCRGVECRPRRFTSQVQGWVERRLVFEATISGLTMS